MSTTDLHLSQYPLSDKFNFYEIAFLHSLRDFLLIEVPTIIENRPYVHVPRRKWINKLHMPEKRFRIMVRKLEEREIISTLNVICSNNNDRFKFNRKYYSLNFDKIHQLFNQENKPLYEINYESLLKRG